jgi:hypothetical protein
MRLPFRTKAFNYESFIEGVGFAAVAAELSTPIVGAAGRCACTLTGSTAAPIVAKTFAV